MGARGFWVLVCFLGLRRWFALVTRLRVGICNAIRYHWHPQCAYGHRIRVTGDPAEAQFVQAITVSR
ncbi:hypothetical protein BN2476_750163 [Paraburkholderia piptadeniae]|uniref:Uncharacterized protein n=1 Tax=Paraburkholderia piptadeniae TaxID=1701573 RepID=A0A1N7SSB3_9BURK|nr:hypothetical protein BN2476_750163 [Paraburkholderia piptadeniae]